MLALEIAAGLVLGGLALGCRPVWLPVVGRLLGLAWRLTVLAAVLGVLGFGLVRVITAPHLSGWVSVVSGLSVVGHGLWTARPRRPTD